MDADFLRAEAEYLNPDSTVDEKIRCDRCGQEVFKNIDDYYKFGDEIICDECLGDKLDEIAAKHYVR